jgi:hypothetical protein
MASDVSLALDGGNPACQVKWPSWPVHDQAEESAVLEVLRSGKWGFGEQVKRFEQAWAQWQGAKHAISCTNGTVVDPQLIDSAVSASRTHLPPSSR